MDIILKNEITDDSYDMTENGFATQNSVTNNDNKHSPMRKKQCLASSSDTDLNMKMEYKNISEYLKKGPIVGSSKKSFESCHRRPRTGLLFTYPFFQLQQQYDSSNPHSTITALCYSCNVILRGHKNVSSNFVKHMKTVHPETAKVYEDCKRSRQARDQMGCSSMEMKRKSYQQENGLNKYISPSSFSDSMTSNDQSNYDLHLIETASANLEQIHSMPTTKPSTTSTSPSKNYFEKPANCAMPSHTIELSKSNLKAIGTLLDNKLNQFAARNNLTQNTQIQCKTDDSNSIEKHETNDQPTTDVQLSPNETYNNQFLMNEIQILKQQLTDVRHDMIRIKKRKHYAHQEMIMINKELNQRKIAVRNVIVEEGQELKDAIQHLLNVQLQLPDINVVNISHMNKDATMSNRLNLIIELSNEKEAQAIYKNRFKLKSTGIFVEPNLSFFARKRKNKLLVLRKEMLRHQPELKVTVRSTELFVNGKKFFWDEVDGISWQETSSDSTLCPVDYLNEVTGCDLTEFLNVLTNYEVQIP